MTQSLARAKSRERNFRGPDGALAFYPADDPVIDFFPMDLRCGPLPPGAIDFFAPMDFFCAPGGPGGPDRPDGAIDLRADMDFRGPSEEGGGGELEPPLERE